MKAYTSYNPEELRPALGPLAELFFDGSVSEIMVDSPERVLVERQGRLEVSSVRFASAAEVDEMVHRLLALSGQRKEPDQSVVQIPFPDQVSRGLAVYPPVAMQGPYVVIRKLMLGRSITWEKLIEWGSVSVETVEFLRQALRAPANILVAGGTGSGKTTIANRLLELVPEDERIVVAENAHELIFEHPGAIFLRTDGAQQMRDLILTASMMRPDWLVIGELLGPEAMAAMEAFGRGHSGVTTIHANSSEDALARLEAFCLMANLGLGLGEIRNLIASALQLIVYQQRMKDRKRRIVEIVEVQGIEDGRYRLQPLFRLNPETLQLERTGAKASWEE